MNVILDNVDQFNVNICACVSMDTWKSRSCSHENGIDLWGLNLGDLWLFPFVDDHATATLGDEALLPFSGVNLWILAGAVLDVHVGFHGDALVVAVGLL